MPADQPSELTEEAGSNVTLVLCWEAKSVTLARLMGSNKAEGVVVP